MPVINERLRVSAPIFSFVGCLVTVALGAGTVYKTLDSFKDGLKQDISNVTAEVSKIQGEVQSKLAEINRRLDDGDTKRSDYLTLDGAAEHAARMAIKNPGLKVPDPKRAGEYFVVELPHLQGKP